MKKILIIILLALAGEFLLITAGLAVDAQGWDETSCKASGGGYWYQNMCITKPPDVKFSIPFGIFKEGINEQVNISKYIQQLYLFGVGAAAVLAVVMIILGGFIWLTAGGSQERVSTGKGYITGAILGLTLAVTSYTALKLVNPSLVIFAPLRIQYLKQATMTGSWCPNPKNNQVTDPKNNNQPIVKAECGHTYNNEVGTNKNARVGYYCVGSFCMPDGTKPLQENNFLSYDCMTPQTACEKLSDWATGPVKTLPEGQGACDRINEAVKTYPQDLNMPDFQKGTCMWVDHSWYNIASADGCEWCSQKELTELKNNLQNNGQFTTALVCNQGWLKKHNITELAQFFASGTVSDSCFKAWCAGK